MATQVVLQERSAAFHQLVRGWDRRLRVQQAAAWLPRAVLPGLVLGVLVAVVSRLRPWLLPEQIVLAAGAAVVVGTGLMLLAVAVWPRPLLVAARHFDRLFGLQERVSTALELLEGRLRVDGSLAARQLDDAWARAQAVRAADALPLVFRWREWGVALALLAVLLVLVLLPNPQAGAVVQASAQQVALADAAEDLKALIEEIASNTALTPEQREQILKALETSINTLQEPNVTPEEAFASLSDTQAALENQADRLNEQSAAQQAAMEAAAEALRRAMEQTQGQAGQNSAIPTLEELREQMAQLSAQQQQEMANALEQAADALQATDPNTANALREAAEALRRGDTQAAQTALEQAQQNMQAGDSAQQNQQQTAQNLNQAAQEVQQSAARISQAGQQGQQTQPQPNQQAQAGQPGEQSQPGEGEPQGQQEQPGAQGQPGQQPGQQGQAGVQGEQGQQGQQGQQPAEGMGQPGQGEQPSDSPSNQPAPGAGDAPGGAGSDDLGGGTQATGGEIEQNNNPDGQGEGQYDPVYAPRRIGGTGSDQIVLEPEPGDVPSVEGEFAENPTGNASVPYNQVFSDYSNAANRALESDYIPLGLRDVVRDYFSSLEPRR